MIEFATIADAQAATISATTEELRVISFDSTAPIAPALYQRVSAAPAHPAKFESADGAWWELSPLLGMTDARALGARSQIGIDNAAYIDNAILAAVALGSELSFPPGRYETSGSHEVGYENFQISFVGDVEFVHTATSLAYLFSIDAGPTANKFRVNFGWDNPPRLTGNNYTSRLLYLRGFHHSFINAVGNTCNGFAFGIVFSVLSHFRFECSRNIQPGGAWGTPAPEGGVVVDQRNNGELTTCCDFYVIFEEIAGDGFVANALQYSQVRGSSEGNTGNGYVEGTGCLANILDGFFCEQNGGSYDYFLNGSGTTLRNCVGISASMAGANLFIQFARDVFVEGGLFVKIVVDSTAIRPRLQRIQNFAASFGGGFVNSSNTLRCISRLEVFSSTSQAYQPDISPGDVAILSGTWINFGVGEATAAYTISDGLVKLTGAVKSGTAGSDILTLPVGMRPAQNKRFVYVDAYSPSLGSLVVTPSGTVQHVNGSTLFVSLDNVSFVAEQ